VRAIINLAAVCALAALASCDRPNPGHSSGPPQSALAGAGERSNTDAMPFAEKHTSMVRDQIAARGVRDERVLAALRAVPRHDFVPDALDEAAYEDRPLPIGAGQTISQPYIVGIMTELARVGPVSKVLEIGTGSGYQAAVLAEVAGEVYSIEIVEPLARQAADTLRKLGYDRIHLRIGDGYAGWPEAAPFDAIVVTAAPPRVPAPLKEQLKVGGRLVIPVGDRWQELVVITRTATGFDEERVFPVAFVPMTGEAQRAREH
jgi:protein-L-isoaspartate(D-aspartate) O-methyltransferase